MKRLLLLLCLLPALALAQLAPIGGVQHCYYKDPDRGTRERDLFNELGWVIVRSGFNPYELAWRKPDGTAVIGNYGKSYLDLHFDKWGIYTDAKGKTWPALAVILTLELDNRLTDSQNDAINAELIAYAYAKGVRHWTVLNEPNEWSALINDAAARSSLAKKAQRLIALVHKNAPGSTLSAPALHGWYEGDAVTERNRNVARRAFLVKNEPWVRTIGFDANVYVATGSAFVKVKALSPSGVTEIARRPGYPPITGTEIKEVAALPVNYVIYYCMSGHPGYELMTAAGVRDEKRIAALKR